MNAPKYFFFKTQPGAPTYAEHAPSIPEEAIVVYFDRLSSTREHAIEALVETGIPRVMAAIKVDTESTNLATQADTLRAIGIWVPTSDQIWGMNLEAVHHTPWTIIYGLARLNTYLVNTGHLSDERLLERLVSGPLLDELPLVVPNSDMTEFIDMGSNGEERFSRDAYLPTPNRPVEGAAAVSFPTLD